MKTKLQIIHPDSALSHLINGIKRLKQDKALRMRAIGIALIAVGLIAEFKFI